jgi:DNA polymerase III alpha subunit (gram-positive type)
MNILGKLLKKMTNNKQQTAVEQFAIALYEKGLLMGNGDEIQELLEQYKEICKEQIISAHNANFNYDNWPSLLPTLGHQYYNETYGDDKQ